MSSTRSPIRWLAPLALVAACSTPAAPSHASPAPSPTAAPSASAGDAWLIVSRATEPTLRVILDSTLEEVTELPVGAPDARWGHVLTATPGERTTVIHNLVVQPGFGGSTQEVDGRWILPTVGLDPIPQGVSADRSTIVLVEADAEHGAAGAVRTISRFAVVDTRLALDYEPRIIELAGAFDFDALSPDGKLLYVAEQVPGPLEGRYQVRVVENGTGTMRDAIIVDKRNIDAQMAGWPVDQERRADGMVMTLYRGAEYPFVHALSSVEAWAVCIDLPTRGFDDVDAADDWGIVSLGNGRSDLAINASLGIAVEIHPTDLSIKRTVDFEASAAAPFQLAKFGHADLGPAGRRVIAAPDGSSVYAAGDGGVVKIGARDLDVEMRYLTGTAIDGLAVTPDGTALFALTQTGGRIVRLDAATGELEGWVGDGGFDQLLGAVPW
jgi:murein DD-endopeptidase MepM/ murein hydrolase activator NlpD